MKTVILLLCILLCSGIYAQTNVTTVGSNRIIQKHLLPAKIQKIGQLDPSRLNVLWNYFTNSFSYTCNEMNITVEELLNIHQFDVNAFENLRQANEEVQFTYREKFQITLRSGTALNTLLQGYELTDLISNLPARPFPNWTSETFTEEDFNAYKLLVWDWAKDYTSEYLALTSNPNIRHIRFAEISAMPIEKQEQLLTGNYIIVD